MDPLTLSALLGAGGSIGGGLLGARSARKARHKMSRRLARAIPLVQSITGKGYAQQEGLSRASTKTQVAGIDAALRELDRSGRQSKREIDESAKRQSASLSQRLTDTGLGSTTKGQQGYGLIEQGRLRGAADIDEGLAGARGQLQMGRAGTEAAGLENLANIAAQRTQTMSALGQMGLLGGQQLGQFQLGGWSQPNALQQALPGIAANFGDYFGQKQAQNQQNDMLMKIFGMQNPGVQGAGLQGAQMGGNIAAMLMGGLGGFGG